MFMRFVHLKVTEETLWEVRSFYEEKVIPTLQATDGCLFASLLQPTVEMDECVSMTLWANQELAEAYESSGSYDRLLDQSEERIAGTTEWRANLTGDREGGPAPLYDPVVEGFPMEVSSDALVLGDDVSPHLYLRIVAVKVDPVRFEDLRQRYNHEIVPALLETPGCRAAFLVEGIKTRTRALSVTIWDSEEDAVRYQISGKFDKLVAKISEFFSGLYQWKLSLSSSGSERVSGSELDVSGYNIVTGRRVENSDQD